MRIAIEKAQEQDRIFITELLRQANMHYVPSPEMPGLTFENYVVAKADGRIVGFCGHKILSATEAKIELLVVDRDYRNLGIGYKLQESRMEAMLEEGVKTVIINSDLPQSIRWYKKHFGYKEIGKLAKLHEFGSPDIKEWTTLSVDLEDWRNKKMEESFAKGGSCHL